LIRVLPVPHHHIVETRAFPGGIRALVSSELERRGFLAAFSERTGGISEAPYSSLNLGSQVGDSPENVRHNRGLLVDSLAVGELAAARQVHGTAVAHVTGRGEAAADADVLVTAHRALPLAIMTADCVAVALASEPEGTAAAAHVGWRGLASGVVQRTMGLFREPGEVVAAIGPAIGPCHYEVGPEVIDAVREGVGKVIVDGSRDAKRTLDLGATVEGLLRQLGAAVVEAAGICTACEPGRFFSHRRDGTTGRQALVLVRL
jgi:YfiH family protein